MQDQESQRTYREGVERLVELMQEAAAPALAAGACTLERDDIDQPGFAPLGARLLPTDSNACPVHLGLDNAAWPGDVFLTVGHDDKAGYEVWARGAGYDRRSKDSWREDVENYVGLLQRIVQAVIHGRVCDWVGGSNGVATVIEIETDQGTFEECVFSRNVLFARRKVRGARGRRYEPYMS